MRNFFIGLFSLIVLLSALAGITKVFYPSAYKNLTKGNISNPFSLTNPPKKSEGLGSGYNHTLTLQPGNSGHAARDLYSAQVISFIPKKNFSVSYHLPAGGTGTISGKYLGGKWEVKISSPENNGVSSSFEVSKYSKEKLYATGKVKMYLGGTSEFAVPKWYISIAPGEIGGIAANRTTATVATPAVFTGTLSWVKPRGVKGYKASVRNGGFPVEVSFPPEKIYIVLHFGNGKCIFNGRETSPGIFEGSYCQKSPPIAGSFRFHFGPQRQRATGWCKSGGEKFPTEIIL